MIVSQHGSTWLITAHHDVHHGSSWFIMAHHGSSWLNYNESRYCKHQAMSGLLPVLFETAASSLQYDDQFTNEFLVVL